MTVSSQAFRDAFALVATSVAVVTTSGPAGLRGLTATSYAPLSDAPASVVICVGRAAASLEAIVTNQAFALNLLAEDQQAVSDLFAGRRGIELAAKFDHCAWQAGELGQPLLQDALAGLECRLSQRFLAESHAILVGEVVGVRTAPQRRPLIYARRSYRRLAE